MIKLTEVANTGSAGGTTNTTVPDRAAPGVVDLSGWSRLSFCIAQLFSLSVLYAKLKMYPDDKIKKLENNFVVDNMTLKHMFELELLMLASAYILRKSYDGILEQYNGNDDDQYFLSESLLLHIERKTISKECFRTISLNSLG